MLWLMLTLAGCRGPEGAAGAAGAPGAAGADGRDGRDGEDGQDGADGVDGAPGADAVPRTKADLYEVTSTIDLLEGENTVVVSCAAKGDMLLTGGCEVLEPWTGAAGVALQSSGPRAATSTSEHASWTCTAVGGEDTFIPKAFRATAICVGVP